MPSAPVTQAVTSSRARTLADITDERQLPLSYLSALIALFLFMVAERVFYSQARGSNPGSTPRAAIGLVLRPTLGARVSSSPHTCAA